MNARLALVESAGQLIRVKMHILFIISRYLRKRGLIIFSAGGMTVAVAVFIVISSVLNGFGSGIVRRLRGTLADIVIEDTSGRGISDYEKIISELQDEIPDVKLCAPSIKCIAMFESIEETSILRDDGSPKIVGRTRYKPHFGEIRGIDPERELRIGELALYLKKGEFFEEHKDIRARDILVPGSNQIIVGTGFPVLALSDRNTHRFKVFDGGRIKYLPWTEVEGGNLIEKGVAVIKKYGVSSRLLSYRVIVSTVSSGSMDPVKEDDFTVRGRFKTKTGESAEDSLVVYMHYKDAQRLLDMEAERAGAFTGSAPKKARITDINVKLMPGAYGDLDAVKAAVNRVLARNGAECTSRGWTEIRGKMLDAVAVERALTFIILTCVVLAMGAGVFVIQWFSVARQVRDIGVMKSIGITDRGIMRIFFGLSLAVGIIGAVLGVGLGIVIAANVNEILNVITDYTGWELYPTDTFYYDKIPSEISLPACLWIGAVAVLVCAIAGFIPARMAARREVVRCLMVD